MLLGAGPYHVQEASTAKVFVMPRQGSPSVAIETPILHFLDPTQAWTNKYCQISEMAYLHQKHVSCIRWIVMIDTWGKIYLLYDGYSILAAAFTMAKTTTGSPWSSKTSKLDWRNDLISRRALQQHCWSCLFGCLLVWSPYDETPKLVSIDFLSVS